MLLGLNSPEDLGTMKGDEDIQNPHHGIIFLYILKIWFSQFWYSGWGAQRGPNIPYVAFLIYHVIIHRSVLRVKGTAVMDNCQCWIFSEGSEHQTSFSALSRWSSQVCRVSYIVIHSAASLGMRKVTIQERVQQWAEYQTQRTSVSQRRLSLKS